MFPGKTAMQRTESLTAEFLLDNFGEGARIDPVLTEEQAAQAEKMARGNASKRYTKQNSRASNVLEYLNDVLDYHGVEVIRTSGHSGYWGNAKYAYLNSGHTTGLELYYNTEDQEWVVGCFMDLYEVDEELQERR